MLLPRAVVNALLFLRALQMFIASLLSMLLPIVLVLPRLLLSVLLLLFLIVPLLLSTLLLLVLILPLLLLSVPLLLFLIVSRLLSVLLLLALILPLLLLGVGVLELTALLLGMVLLLPLLLVLCIRRSSDPEKQRQSCRVDDSDCVHMYYLYLFQVPALDLAQASSCRVRRAADGFA